MLYSCEVSFLVRVDDDIRSRHEGLAELTSEDIAKYMTQRALDGNPRRVAGILKHALE